MIRQIIPGGNVLIRSNHPQGKGAFLLTGLVRVPLAMNSPLLEGPQATPAG
jgi:hypothetical protein